MSDVEWAIRMAQAMEVLRVPGLRAAIETLGLPTGSRGLDAGCGPGLQTLLLKEATGPESEVVGLDISPEMLARAREIVADAGLSERVSFREGSVDDLPFADDSFDWAWSVDCVGYAPMEPLPLVKQLARVVRPGGTVAILAWSSERLLPGYPALEARLSATSAGIAPFVEGKDPAAHFPRALGWLRAAGLEDATAATFAGGACAPLSADARTALAALLEMRWPGVESELSAEDWKEHQRLCLPDSTDFILDDPDYYAFFTVSMFYGKVGA